MTESGCVACDGEGSPLSVTRVSSLVSSLVGADEGGVGSVVSYTALLKAGVLSDLHMNVCSMIFSGVTETEAKTYVDDEIAAIVSPEPAEEVTRQEEDYSDDWGFSADAGGKETRGSDVVRVSDSDDGWGESDPAGDGWGDAPFEGDYLDDWF